MKASTTKPSRYKYQSGDVLFLLDNRITPSRLRQISNQNNIGFLVADIVPLDGSPPKKFTRWYSEADIKRIVTMCTRLKKAAKSGDLKISEKLRSIA